MPTTPNRNVETAGEQTLPASRDLTWLFPPHSRREIT
jgi:hypothetical protein